MIQFAAPFVDFGTGRAPAGSGTRIEDAVLASSWAARTGRATDRPANDAGDRTTSVPDPLDPDDVDEIEALGDQIATLAAHIHAATHQLLVLIAEFDERRGWEADGHRSCAHWLAFRTGIELVTAREHVRVARALRNLPQVSDAMSNGEISFAKARALTRCVSAETEGELLAFARDVTAAQLEHTVRSMKLLSRKDEVELERERHRWRSFSVFPDGTGVYEVRGRLDPEVAAVLMRAIEAASDALYGSTSGVEEIEPQQRRADALGLVAERALAAGFAEATVEAGNTGRLEDASAEAHGLPPASGAGPRNGVSAKAPDTALSAETLRPANSSAEALDAPATADASAAQTDSAEAQRARPCRGSGGLTDASAEESRPLINGSCAERYQVVLHVDAATLRSDVDSGRSELADGTRLSPETARRLSCDAGVVRVTRDRDGSVLDVGRRTRTIPPALRRALEVRDRGCRFPGCGSRFVEAHHVIHWIDGGPTSLTNCCLTCRDHHRLVHEEGYTVQFPPGGQPTFYTPRGLPVPDKPLHLPNATIEALVRANVSRGVLPDGWTCTARYKRDADVPGPDPDLPAVQCEAFPEGVAPPQGDGAQPHYFGPFAGFRVTAENEHAAVSALPTRRRDIRRAAAQSHVLSEILVASHSNRHERSRFVPSQPVFTELESVDQARACRRSRLARRLLGRGGDARGICAHKEDPTFRRQRATEPGIRRGPGGVARVEHGVFRPAPVVAFRLLC